MSISDSGPDLSADVLPRIFEPLYSTKSSGVGLGLPIVRQIMEQHHGGVDIGNNEEGVGAHVVPWLPLDQGKEGTAT